MAINGVSDGALLSKPSKVQREPLQRDESSYISTKTFQLPKGESKHYQQQFADMYFARLAQLKPAVEKIGAEVYSSFTIAGEKARRVDRVLDVRQGELCWVVGTIFMDLPLKQNVLEDIGREHWIAAPPPRERYRDNTGQESIMLEDESGRLKLVGHMLSTEMLVTGAIVTVIGTENRDGDFEVLDIRIPDLPRQPQRWEAQEAQMALRGSPLTPPRPTGGKIAIVSGLDISKVEGDTLPVELLMEYLLGEAAGLEDQEDAAQITRLIIAGNALTQASPIPSREEIITKSKQRKYGYDATTYNATPTVLLDELIASLLPTIPVTILPGDSDPTATSLPQPPIHMAFFPLSRAYAELPDSDEASWFDSTTNPAEFHVGGHLFLATGGQPVEDVFRYLDSSSRVEMMEAMLRWRLVAPTAPDTLWCYPFQDKDQFVLNECPHVFIAGNQPQFETSVIDGPVGQKVRLLAVPKYKETGQIVLMDEDTLECEVIQIGLYPDEFNE